MPIGHAFKSGKADSADPALVQPSHWNADHLFIPVPVLLSVGGLTWTNQPAALTEFAGVQSRRSHADLRNAVDFRFFMQVVTASLVTAANLFLQFSTDGGANWANAEAGGTTNGHLSSASAGAKISPWVPLHASAKVDGVLLRAAGTAGTDSTGDPGFGHVGAYFR